MILKVRSVLFLFAVCSSALSGPLSAATSTSRQTTKSIAKKAHKPIPVSMPKALRGRWDLGPENCKLPLKPDLDSPMKIEEKRIVGYEDIDKVLKVTRVALHPAVWIVTTSNEVLAAGVILNDAYVLSGDDLTVTDGTTTHRYRRCH